MTPNPNLNSQIASVWPWPCSCYSCFWSPSTTTRSATSGDYPAWGLTPIYLPKGVMLELSQIMR